MATPRSIIIDDLMRAADRRDMLCANVPSCTHCQSNQVQLTHSHHAPALPDRAGLHGPFNLIGQLVEVRMEFVIHLTFDLIGCKVADQGSLCGVLPEFFDRSSIVLHGAIPRLFE
jgi:hypothetical protein